MTGNQRNATSDDSLLAVIKRAFAEFLMFPAVLVAGMVAIVIATLVLDAAAPAGVDWLRAQLTSNLFSSAATTADLLGTVASGLFTVTSITISLLLIALQQAATSLTQAIYDQFLRRRENQVFFGYFVGVTLCSLLTLATVDETFNPVLGATLILTLTAIALLLLLVMLYSAIDQMRPAAIIDTIHDLTLSARGHHDEMLSRTRRAPSLSTVASLVRADRHGFVTGIDLNTMEKAVGAEGGIEILIERRIGAFVAYGDPLAQIRTAGASEVPASVAETVRNSIKLERQRDIGQDPIFGIEQLESIGWTSISSAKSDPSSGQLCIRSLRDLLARWCADAHEASEPQRILPIVYHDDLPGKLIASFESIAVVCSESMQHQSLAEVLDALASLLERLPAEQGARVQDMLLRTLSALADHVPTTRLDEAMQALAAKLHACGDVSTAAAVDTARRRHLLSVGTFNSRTSRGSVSGVSGQLGHEC